MKCHKCKCKIEDQEIFKGGILPFIADGQRKFICEYCSNNQPERLNPENINIPIFSCDKCKFSAPIYRNRTERTITCPECQNINICDSLNSMET